jgi:hypothetical protein
MVPLHPSQGTVVLKDESLEYIRRMSGSAAQFWNHSDLTLYPKNGTPCESVTVRCASLEGINQHLMTRVRRTKMEIERAILRPP